jgi:putative DNA primase/helicase
MAWRGSDAPRTPCFFLFFRHHSWASGGILIEIINHLHLEGYPVSDFIPDGKIKRFEIEKNDRRAGFYIAHRNYLIRTGEEFFHVQYGSWRTGEIKSFTTLKGILTPDDKKNLDKQLSKDRRQIELDKKKEQAITAEEVEEKWNHLAETRSLEFEYLTRKQISECELGVRYDNFNQEIFVPLRDHHGRIWSIQRIDRKGEKRFHPGGRTRGCFHAVGDLAQSKTIYIAEGLATAASIHLATGQGTVCAFSASNLVEVSGTLRRLYPDKSIFICADGDEAGESAAKKTGLPYLIPRLSQKGTDWNDLHCQEGLATVKEQLSSLANLPAPVEVPLLPEVLHTPFPHENEKTFAKLDTTPNIAELLRRLNITVRYNVICKRNDILIPGKTYSVDNYMNGSFATLVSYCKQARVPTDNLNGHLTVIADANQYNPVSTWIESKPWDGVARLQDFCNTITSPDEPFKEVLMKKWLISAVAAAYEPSGVYGGGMLVLRGKQYIGKTQWFKKLCPKELGVLQDGLSLRLDDKDSVFQVISKWIVELGEVESTFRKSDLDQLKAFLTKTHDIIRRPYARMESEFPRRTIFFASVNEQYYLNDPTGNRRFWTIDCEKIDHSHTIDMQQLWAEVRELYFQGEPWILTNEENELLNVHNQQFEAMDPIHERIESAFDWGNRFGESWMGATQVCMAMGMVNPHRQDIRKAAAYLHKKTRYEKHRKRFLIPVKLQEF